MNVNGIPQDSLFVLYTPELFKFFVNIGLMMVHCGWNL